MEPTNPAARPAQIVDAELARPRRGVWPLLLIVALLLLLAASLVLNAILGGVVIASGGSGDERVREKYHSHQKHASDKIAILAIDGVILESEGFVKRQIDRARDDDAVKALVVRIDSPGGSVSASDFLYHHLKRYREEKRRPVVISMGGLAASGGYYLAMAAGQQPDVVFAEPTTWTGSIGVVIPHYHAAGLMDKVGVSEDSIASHRLKTMGSFSRAMTAEEREIFKGLVDESFDRFKAIIRDGRKRFADQPAALDRLATGQIFTAQQAKDAGLVDRIGFLDDAVRRAIELAGVDADNVRVVKYKPELGLMDLFLGASARPQLDLAALLDAGAPRAYYLYTTLPLLTARGR